jgi:hypothetical protein
MPTLTATQGHVLYVQECRCGHSSAAGELV